MIGPDHDVFSTLISPTVRSSVPLFVSSHYKFAQSLDDPRMALQSRFVVTDVAINKAGKLVHHESFAVWVTDTKLDRKHYFIIEQQPSALSKSSRFDCFTSFPASGMVLKSIENAFKNMRPCSPRSLQLYVNWRYQTNPPHPLSTWLRYDRIPKLISIFHTFHRHYDINPCHGGGDLTQRQPICQASEFGGGHHIGVSPRRSEEGWNDPEIQSSRALLIWCRLFGESGPRSIYSLFDNQCYMFASVMFNAVVKLYSLPNSAYHSNHQAPSTSSGPVPVPSPEAGAPSNANLLLVHTPDKSGRWSGVLIIDPIVKSTIIEVVMSRFKEGP